MSLSHFANRVGTYLTVLSHGKFALNKYMASAIKKGVDVREPDACVVINIGQQRTDIAFLANGQVLLSRSMSISCDTFIEDIIFYMARMHNMRIDEPIAKQIWDAVGSAVSELEDAPETFDVVALNRITGQPMRIPVGHQEISHCLRRNIMSIVLLVGNLMETMPTSCVISMFRRGIYLTGEGAGLRGLAQLFEEILRVPCKASLNQNV